MMMILRMIIIRKSMREKHPSWQLQTCYSWKGLTVTTLMTPLTLIMVIMILLMMMMIG